VQNSPTQFTVPVGDTRTALDAIFQARFTDPAQRRQAVDAFIRQAGLSPFLFTPITFYANQIYLFEYLNGTFALIGAQNTLTFGLFWSRSEPITSSGQTLPDTFLLANNLTTTGGTVTFSHRLSALTSLALSGTHSISRGENTTGLVAPITATQDTYLLTVSHQFSPNTYGSVGLRYQTFDASGSSQITEHAALAGVTHNF
jgi:uncharacterized protein (PEP-CTERM system associated)